MKKPILAITVGDPGGIGPEITLKALKARFRRSARLLLIGPLYVYKETARAIKLPFKVNRVSAFEPARLSLGIVNLLDLPPPAKPFVKGRVSKINAQIALDALKVASHLASAGLINGIVTTPLNKEAVRLIDPSFVGHTEFLAKVSRARRFAMMFVDGPLRVTLVTIHVPLKDVPRLISKSAVADKICLTHTALKRFFKIRSPRIAVCALNPHGEEFGKEEAKIIRPAVRSVLKKGIRAVGPLPADQLFYSLYKGEYDAAVSMYHDQALAPFKMVAFRSGVNCTLGLPFVRTSPDHGTAFDIAYRNKADALSMKSAIQTALGMLSAS